MNYLSLITLSLTTFLLAIITVLSPAYGADAVSTNEIIYPAVESPSLVRPVVVGSVLPNAAVVTHQGETKGLRDVLGSGKKILVVYRGGWCPYCVRHFAALAASKVALEKDGWEMFALSPDSRATMDTWKAKNGDDGVQHLSDDDADAICALGLGFVLDPMTREKYKKYNIDLEAASGKQHYILPVPTVLVIVDGTIRGLHADADYSRRLRPELLTAMIAAIEADTQAAAQKKK